MSEINYRWAGMSPSETKAQQMQGYRPSGQNMTPPKDYSQYYEDEPNGLQQQRDREAEIAKLENELAAIDAQIAEFDRMNPGLDSGDVEFAAKMAEAGNISPYMQMVNGAIARDQMRESSRSNAMGGVWNGIDNARNALAGWSKMSDDQREMARDVARVELDKARRAANGGELPAEWYDVRRMLEGGASEGDGMRNKDYWRNFLQGKLDNGTLDDPDIKRLEDYAHENAGRELTKELYAIRDEFAPKTNSAKKRGAAARAAAAESFKAFGTRTNGMTDAERIRAFNDAKARGERWTKYYVVSGTDIVAKEVQ